MQNIFKVEFLYKAEEDFKKLDSSVAQRILDKIKWLSKQLPYIIPRPLTGNFKNMYKLRVGDWRVIYNFDMLEKIIKIHEIGHRKDIYKL